MERFVTEDITKHTVKENNLLSRHQWAYKEGKSTELLLANMTEQWRFALDKKRHVYCLH